MADPNSSTSNLAHNEQIELWKDTESDACGFKKTKSSEIPSGKAPVHEDSDDYNMDHPNRGTCLVLNHAIYDVKYYAPRKGTDRDVQSIEKTFKKLGFSVDICSDYNRDAILKKIKELSKQDHSDNDCLCIIALTHGEGNNTIHAKDQPYTLESLWGPFTADNCITLAGKPKLFFISACRGEKLDGGVLLNLPPASDEGKRSQTDGVSSTSYMIPTEADFLFGFSTAPGYCSWRSSENGTWYIQSLCDILNKYAATTDLVDVLTKTAQEVTKHFSFDDKDKTKHNKKQVPEFHSRLLRRVYFTPKKKQENITSQNLLPQQENITSQNLLPQQETITSQNLLPKQETVTPHRNESKHQYCDLL